MEETIYKHIKEADYHRAAWREYDAWCKDRRIEDVFSDEESATNEA